MNKNDKNETTTEAKPQVRIVDLAEVREILGAAAPGGGGTTAPGTGTTAAPPVTDTTGCSW